MTERKRSRKRKIRKKELMLTAAVMAVTAATVGMVFLFQKKVDSTVIAQGAYNYFGEKKVEFTGKCRLQYDDGVVELSDENGKHQLDSKPLYTREETIVLPLAYTWNNLDTGVIYRLEHFSQIQIENQSITLTDGNLQSQQARGFLFDGVDTYIFLESVELTCGETSVRLPALSYAVARYGNTLQYYAYGGGESKVIQTGEEDQIALFGNGDSLNMGTDTVYRADGTWYLLVVQPKAVERMKEE